MQPADTSNAAPRQETAWDYVQRRDAERWGEEILDPRLQAQWGRAVFLAGTLPYLWKVKVPLVRRAIFDALELRPGGRVFVLGEALEPCGFLDDTRAHRPGGHDPRRGDHRHGPRRLLQ